MKTYRITSSEMMQRAGERFATTLLKGAPRRRATVVVLSGELGAGKTTFVQGFLRGAGVRRRAQSPTFVLMRRYKLPAAAKAFSNIVHMDAYRLKGPDQLAALSFDVILKEPRNLVLIEWGERIKDALPRGTRRLQFRHGRKENERTVVVK